MTRFFQNNTDTASPNTERQCLNHTINTQINSLCSYYKTRSNVENLKGLIEIFKLFLIWRTENFNVFIKDQSLAVSDNYVQIYSLVIGARPAVTELLKRHEHDNVTEEELDCYIKRIKKGTKTILREHIKQLEKQLFRNQKAVSQSQVKQI